MSKRETVIPTARHEASDIGEGFIWGALGVMLGTLLLFVLLIVWLYPRSTLDRTLSLPLPIYPAPRLQPNPPADMQKFRAEEAERLNGGGSWDRSQGERHIPIAEAMQIVADRGIADWPAPGKASP